MTTNMNATDHLTAAKAAADAAIASKDLWHKAAVMALEHRVVHTQWDAMEYLLQQVREYRARKVNYYSALKEWFEKHSPAVIDEDANGTVSVNKEKSKAKRTWHAENADGKKVFSQDEATKCLENAKKENFVEMAREAAPEQVIDDKWITRQVNNLIARLEKKTADSDQDLKDRVALLKGVLQPDGEQEKEETKVATLDHHRVPRGPQEDALAA